MCKQSANVYDIEFVRFKLREMAGNTTLFEVCQPEVTGRDRRIADDSTDEGRFVSYQFSADFLKLETVGAT